MTHPSHPSRAAVVAARARFEREVAGRTVCDGFLDTVAAQGDWLALRGPAATWDGGPDASGFYSWSDYADRVALVSGGLRRLGVRRGEMVALLLRNRPDFHFVDLGAVFAGAIPVSLYPTASPDGIAHLAAHSRAVAVVVQDLDLADRVAAVADRLPDLRHVIVVDPGDEPLPKVGPAVVATLAEVVDGPPLDLAAAAGQVRPEDPVAVAYTAGTTGPPKGVVLTHHNVCYATRTHFEVLGRSIVGLRQLSYLPMAYIAERLMSHYHHVLGGTNLTICENPAELPAAMAQVRPQWMFCGTRQWERLRADIERSLADDPDGQAEFAAAQAVGWRVHGLRHDGAEVPVALATDWHRLKEEVISTELFPLGLDDVVLAISGPEPLAPDTLRFFLSCGVTICDGYGATESTGLMAWSPYRSSPGTCGRPLPGLDMRLGADVGVEPGIGEIEVRGPSIFSGYLRDPARTAEAFTPDGYYRTGDLGRWDDEGNLSVLERVGELMVPVGGRPVSPWWLETAVKREFPIFGQACAIGDGHPYLTMIMMLEPEQAKVWAGERGLIGTLHKLAGCHLLRDATREVLTRVNATVGPGERIREFLVVGDQWLPGSELLTSTGKVRREAVRERYAAEIDAMYL